MTHDIGGIGDIKQSNKIHLIRPIKLYLLGNLL